MYSCTPLMDTIFIFHYSFSRAKKIADFNAVSFRDISYCQKCDIVKFNRYKDYTNNYYCFKSVRHSIQTVDTVYLFPSFPPPPC